MALEGNKNQLFIAAQLTKGLTGKQVSEQFGIPLPTVKKVQSALAHGWKPDLSEESIANAPEPTVVGIPKADNDDTPLVQGNGKKPTGSAKMPAAGYVSFSPIQLRCQYTPIMYMGRIVSVEEFGWDTDMAFEDWMDVIIYHFFKDRGYTLQGYIKDADASTVQQGQEQEEVEEVAV